MKTINSFKLKTKLNVNIIMFVIFAYKAQKSSSIQKNPPNNKLTFNYMNI